MNTVNVLPFPFDVSLWIHILGGVVALVTFTIPLFSRKGGRLHIISGWIYVVGMMAVVFGAFLITPWRIFFDPLKTSSSQVFAIFLAYVALLSLVSLQQGLVVLKVKTRPGPLLNFNTTALPVIFFFASAGMIVYGVTISNWLIIVFSIIGVRGAVGQILYWKNAPAHNKSWWFYHLENMFTSCIATVTAFIVAALPRLFPSIGSGNLLMWLAPSIVMVPWMIWFHKKYEKQFNVKKTAPF